VTNGPFLYDDGPAPLHTGTPRRRSGLLLAVFGGTIVLAVLLVVLTPLLKGSQEQQAKDSVGVFLKALAQGDTTTADEMLCEKEHARLQPDQIAADYVGSGTGQIVRVDRAQVGGDTVAQVSVRWSDGATTRITVVGENGPHVCGSSHTG
jgi:hypothetical protein